MVQAGEDILTAYDTWAVDALRRNKLVWSGWGNEKSLGSNHHRIGDSPWGIRLIENIDGGKFRLFLLSLLWRAAVTKLPEFDTVRLPDDHIEALRSLICEGDPGPVNFYPAQLTQISTLGEIHNHAPLADMKSLPILDTHPMRHTLVPIFRFYFDGLIVHFDRRQLSVDEVGALGNMVVGQEKSFLVSTQSYEGSYQSLQTTNVQIQNSWPSVQGAA